ncbi:MAG: hypothetical protein F6K63_24435 [Moorea sp. SIO1G6]|uniref:hypothetical protein n=1 Tax=unclassified Moorena TaxID=2683338 RepID=UPI0013B827B2|nr:MULTISPECIES: hypothetical protein [unclassified Moorena]NEQ11026.1 hypothetical protein [Moorena sp. SIO4E2]NET67361.1 hypothetical protein [Moorena sp. SIO1G6]
MAQITISDLSETNNKQKLQDIPYAELNSVYGGGGQLCLVFLNDVLNMWDDYDNIVGHADSNSGILIGWN